LGKIFALGIFLIKVEYSAIPGEKPDTDPVLD
jgi:hypothetical protein